MKALILASGVSRPRKPEKSSMGFAEVLQIRKRLLAGFWLGGDLDLLIESDAPVDALTRADLKWNLEEHLHLPVDIIFLEKGKKRNAFQELAYSRSGIL